MIVTVHSPPEGGREKTVSSCAWRWGVLLFFLIRIPLVAADEMRASTPVTHASQPVRAQLTSREQTVLSAEIAGKISSMAVREGQHFQKGDRLVQLDCSIHRAWLEKAKATLLMAQQKKNITNNLQKLGSTSSLEVGMALAEEAKAKADITIHQATVEKCTIHAPFAGRVAKQLAHTHQFVTEGANLLEVLSDGNMEMKFIVPSLWLTWLKPRTPLTIHVKETDQRYPAEVTILGARIDPVSQTIKLTGRVKGAFPELLPGMTGVVTFPSPQALRLLNRKKRPFSEKLLGMSTAMRFVPSPRSPAHGQ